MNWIRENRFLTGFIAVVAVGVAVLGFLLYSAYGTYSEASQKYDEQAAALKNLQGQAPYPSAENLAKLVEQKEAMRTAVSDMAQQLSILEFPAEPLHTTEFQDKLRAAVSATVEHAAQKEVKLPEPFYLSYNEYQTTLPKDDATATALGRELKAVALVVNDLIEAKPEAILGLAQVRVVNPASTAGPGRPPGRSQTPAQPLVTSHAFDLRFLIEQARLRKFLNGLTKANPQFFILRNIRIANQTDKGPSRIEGAPADAAAAAGSVPDASGVAGAAKSGSLHFIIGTEKLEVAARIEIVDFNPPPATKK